MGYYVNPEAKKDVAKLNKEQEKIRKKAEQERKQIEEELKYLSSLGKKNTDENVKQVQSSLKERLASINRTIKENDGVDRKEYYQKHFPKKREEMLQQTLKANPNLQLMPPKDVKIGGKVHKAKYLTGVLVDKKTGQTYPIEDPGKMPKKSASHRSAVRTFYTLQQAAGSQPYTHTPKDMKKRFHKDKHGKGGGFFGGLTKAFSSALPKITIGKDLGLKNIGKALTSAYKGAGKVGSTLVKTIGKGTEGLVANTVDLAENLAQGDFKGIGKEALELVQTGKDIGKGFTTAGVQGLSAGVGTVGAGTGSKDISRAATDIEREGSKGIQKYGDIAADIAANVATGGTYGAAKAALTSLSEGGLSGLVDKQGLMDLASSYAASQAGLDPNAIKMGFSAAQGDLTGAALGAVGIDNSYANMLKSGLKGDLKGALIGQVSDQLGINPEIAEKIASGSLKGAALNSLGEQLGISPDNLKQAQKMLGGDLQQKLMGLAGQQLGIGDEQMAIGRGLASGDLEELERTGRVVVSDQAGAYLPDEQNQAADLMQAAGLERQTVRDIQSAQEQASQTYKIASGDTASKIAKKMGISLEELKAANPGIKDFNKIKAGANLNIPQKIQDLSGPIAPGVVESGKMSQQQFDANKAFQEWTKKQTGYVGKEKKAAMKQLFLDRAAGKIPNDKFAVFQSQIEQGKIPTEYKAAATTPTEAAPKAPAKTGGGILDSISGFINENPNLISGAANIAGGAAGYFLADKQRQEALKDLQRGMSGFEEIKKTDLKSEAAKVKRASDLMAMRKAGLEGFKQRAEMGLTPEDEAMLRQTQKQSLRQGAAQRQALTERAIQQGAQGGQQFMTALQAAGATQQELSEAQDRIAAESFRAKQQALRDLTTSSQQAMSSDYEQDLARSQQLDAIERFNEEQKLRGVEGIANLREKRAEMLLGRGEQLGALASTVGQAISTPIQAQQQQKRELELAKTKQPMVTQPTAPKKETTPKKETPVSNLVSTAQKTGIKPVADAAQKVQQVTEKFQGIPFEMPKSEKDAIKTGKDIFDMFKGK